MTTQLDLYNGALRLLKERRLASLTENREPRRLLDDAWGDGSSTGAVPYCLELGQWNWAMRTVQIDYSPSIDPSFGYRYAFDHPSDMVRLAGVFSDEFCQFPLLQYQDEGPYWYSDLQTIYVRLVSNAVNYGAALSNWPESFAKVVEAYLAVEIGGNLTQGENKVLLAQKVMDEALKKALSLDAQRNPTTFPPEGAWVGARGGRSSRSRWSGTYR